MSKGGRREGAGRKPGVGNKINTELKEMIKGALEGADPAGGQAYLIKQAQDNPTAFLTLLGKIIPAELNAKLSGIVTVNGSLNFIKPRD